MNRGIEHPVSYNLSDETLDSLVSDYTKRGIEFVKSLSIAWDFDTPFDQFHDISAAEYADGLVYRISPVNLLHSLLGLPRQYRAGNFWNTSRPRKTAGILHDIESDVALTPPWLVFTSGSLYVRSGHNRFAIGFINHSGEMPILLTPSDAASYDRRTEQDEDPKPDNAPS